MLAGCMTWPNGMLQVRGTKPAHVIIIAKIQALYLGDTACQAGAAYHRQPTSGPHPHAEPPHSIVMDTVTGVVKSSVCQKLSCSSTWPGDSSPRDHAAEAAVTSDCRSSLATAGVCLAASKVLYNDEVQQTWAGKSSPWSASQTAGCRTCCACHDIMPGHAWEECNGRNPMALWGERGPLRIIIIIIIMHAAVRAIQTATGFSHPCCTVVTTAPEWEPGIIIIIL
jgi:hypothetical protein